MLASAMLWIVGGLFAVAAPVTVSNAHPKLTKWVQFAFIIIAALCWRAA